MRFAIKKAEKFRRKGILGWDYLMDSKASVMYIEISTRVSKRKNSVNDRIYFILEGKAEFSVKSKTVVVGEKEVIQIPRDTIYSYTPKGKVKLVEVNIPPYNIDKEVFYEK